MTRINTKVHRATASWIHKQTGMRIDERNWSHVWAALHGLAIELKMTPEAYRDEILKGAIDPQPFIDEVTVHESFFMRNRDNLLYACTHVIPKLRQRDRLSSISVLSAGCAQGEEAYSFALLSQEVGIDPSVLEITGIDVSRTSIDAARKGIYNPYAFRSVTDDFMQQYFRPSGPKHFELNPATRSRVKFRRMDLVTQAPDVLKEKFDIIFCQNLLFYLTPASLRNMLRVFKGLLKPGGWLFVDPSEAALPQTHFESAGPLEVTGFRPPGTESDSPIHAKAVSPLPALPQAPPVDLSPLLTSVEPLVSHITQKNTDPPANKPRREAPSYIRDQSGTSLLNEARTSYENKEFQKSYALYAELEALGLDYRARSMLGRAQILGDSGEDIQAIELAENALRLHNALGGRGELTRAELIQAHTLIGLLLRKKKLNDAAKPHLEKVLELDPANMVSRLIDHD
ncbi:MAG: CheR family methyltransferase [Myxococcota bacterium]|nr:CheR family methyltransferase [Myxococcota bacterium]